MPVLAIANICSDDSKCVLTLSSLTGGGLPPPLLQASELFQSGRLPITQENRDKFVSGIPGLPPTWAMDLPSPVLELSASSTSMQKRYSHIRQADCIMINTCYALEKPVLDARSRYDGVGTPDLRVSLVAKLLDAHLVGLVPELLGHALQTHFPLC